MDIHEEHAARVALAGTAMAELAPRAAADPLRPAFHVTARGGWINDPNGPIQFRGRYHVFMQYATTATPGPKHWAHVSSEDLAHWRHEPVALAPGPAESDSDGIYSGCCVDDHGTPTAVYTGVRPEVQCIATSDDDLRTWRKYDGNPVIPARPRDGLRGFRDPNVWREGNEWRMVIGSGIEGEGGAALLFGSSDLRSWTYLGELCTGFGYNWECPMFFPLGDAGQWVLAVSPHDHVRYAVGEYDGRTFKPGRWRRMDLGPWPEYYAPNGLLDSSGRRIVWGWSNTGVSPDRAWTGSLTLPRVLTLGADETLRFDVPDELAALRGDGDCVNDVALNAGECRPLDVEDACLELDVTIARDGAGVVGLMLGVPVTIDLRRGLVTVGREAHEFDLHDNEDELRVRAFRDRSILELYLNGRACLTRVLFPALEEARDTSTRAAVFAREAPVLVRSMKAWPLAGIWTG